MKNTTYLNRVLFMLVAATVLLTSCDEEDPFVDRTVAPVLIVFEGVSGYLAGGGLTSTPTIRKTITPDNVTDPVEVAVQIYELDKAGLLDHTVGIDSIPVSGLGLKLAKRDGTLTMDLTSDAAGRASITTTWEALGIENAAELAAEATEINIGIALKGSHNGQSFTRYAQIQFYSK